VDLRYGTLVDVARRVHAGEPVSLGAAHVNAIWQGDASSCAFRGLALCASPPRSLVVTSPDALSVREVAQGFARRFGKSVHFEGAPGPALLGDASCRAGRVRERLLEHRVVRIDRVDDEPPRRELDGMPSTTRADVDDHPSAYFLEDVAEERQFSAEALAPVHELVVVRRRA
jgi:hypothetical protein